MAFKKKIRGMESRYYYVDFWIGQALGGYLISVDIMEKLELVFKVT